jgi:hypothetical protein
MLRRFLLAGILCLTASGSSPWDAEGQAWWKNVEYLASDGLEGRNVGTRGFDLAANYVATEYERTGLKAAGNDGYFQKVWFTEASLQWANIRFQRNGKWVDASIPAEAQLNFDAHSSAKVESRVVFAGYGLQIPEADYDDLKGLPLKGAVVAYLAGGPDEVAGNLKSHYESPEMRWKAMKAAGAVGMIVIPNPKNMETPWPKQAANWGAPRLSLLDSEFNPFEGLKLNVSWNPSLADDLFARSGRSFSQILEAANSNHPLPHFETGITLRSEVSVKTRLVPSKNVVAVHRGTDFNLQDEYVVVSAHLDHLGMETIRRTTKIFPGAMDDASGISSIIEIAKKLRDVPTKRSILFLALTGEEKGELGSTYFTHYPPVKGHIVANLNMDMFLPIFPLKWLEVQGLDESTLGHDMKSVAEAAGVQVQTDKEPDKNRFIRSDQYSFVKAGIPALAFKFGYQKGDPEEKIYQDWFATRYHGVKDDLKQPVDLTAAAQFDDILKSLLVRVADADEAPKWHEDSFFKRFAEPGM